MPPKEKLAAGGLVAAILSFLLYQNAARQKEYADLVDRISHLEGRQEYLHGLPTLDEIQAEAKR